MTWAEVKNFPFEWGWMSSSGDLRDLVQHVFSSLEIRECFELCTYTTLSKAMHTSTTCGRMRVLRSSTMTVVASNRQTNLRSSGVSAFVWKRSGLRQAARDRR